MAKVSPASIKYMVRASFEAQGPLEKPDVIGALFGQTEGLLGDELEMRELQKEGKIGRIEVELQVVDGKSVGKIELPSALDKSSTTLVAAALETIDKVGPTEAKITIEQIEDVRGSKRDFILERAKALLGKMDDETSGTMSKALKEDSRTSKIQEYGEERLPAGDLSGSEVIVVEGRADVVNMLKNRVNNVIGMNGTKLPKEIATLGKSKEITLFIDGDRGGKLIAGNVISNVDVKYVATAPDGKEVEELEGKEILMALRKKISTAEFVKKERIVVKKNFENPVKSSSYSSYSKPTQLPTPTSEPTEADAKEKIKSLAPNVKSSKKAIFLNYDLEIEKEPSTRDIARNLNNSSKKILAVLLDGNVSTTILSAAENHGVKYLAATKFSSASADSSIKLISL